MQRHAGYVIATTKVHEKEKTEKASGPTSVTDTIVLIDTSAWICFFARRGYKELKQTISALLDENRVAIAGPVLIELIQGCRTEKEKRS